MKPWTNIVRPRWAAADLLVITLLVIAANWLVSPQDPGFTSINPSPYLLMPILLGARYGFNAGASAGLLAFALIMAGRWLVLKEPLTTLLLSQAYTGLALLITGAITGEVQHFFAQRLEKEELEKDHLRQRTKQLAMDYRLVRASKDELDQAFAARDNEVSALDTEIRQLFSQSGDDLYRALLLVLNRQARVTDAAIYELVHISGRLVRKGTLSEHDSLPTSIKTGDIELVDLALERNTMVRIADIWELKADYSEPYLLAQPLIAASGRPFGVVVISGIPFVSLNKKTLRKINTICKWGAQIILYKTHEASRFRMIKGLENKRVFYTQPFLRALRLAIDSHRQHNISSYIILISLPDLPIAAQDRLEQSIMPTVREGDFVTQLETPHPTLLFLLTMTGQRGASIFLKRSLGLLEKQDDFRHKVRHIEFSIADISNEEVFWQQVNQT